MFQSSYDWNDIKTKYCKLYNSRMFPLMFQNSYEQNDIQTKYSKISTIVYNVIIDVSEQL